MPLPAARRVRVQGLALPAALKQERGRIWELGTEPGGSKSRPTVSHCPAQSKRDEVFSLAAHRIIKAALSRTDKSDVLQGMLLGME